jgi:DNA-binding NarL/FixJ family response regulator
MDSTNNKINVFLVDDHGLFRESTQAMLTFYEDIEVVGEAGDGIEAIDKIHGLAVDVVLLDIAMPHMNGIEVCRRLKNIDSNIKIMILTQYISKEHIICSINMGASGYVPKKAVASDLASAIRVVYNGDFILHPVAATILVDDYSSLIKRDKSEYKIRTNGSSLNHSPVRSL